MALQRRVHHVRRVDRVHVVGRERSILLALVDGLLVEVVSKTELLQDCVNLLRCANCLIRLDARKSHGVRPLHCFTSMRNNLGAFGKPVLNLVGV